MDWYTKDYGLRAAQLDDKYNPDGDGQHPGYTRFDWRSAINRQNTLLGYWHWVEYQLSKEEEELDRDNPYNQGN